jgi:hypothetical protein
MKRMVHSAGYARARLANALIFAALGALVAYRTFAAAGLSWVALPGCVLGLAMIALGVVRWRDYLAARRAR